MENKVQNISQNRRIIGLDIFRILAALTVFLFHSQLQAECHYGPLSGFVSMGAIVMTGFFMLSGFVLYLNYNKKNLIRLPDLKSFYLKRCISILPIYYAVALIHILFVGKESLTENLVLAPIEILGLQSTFASLFMVSHNDGTWFISILLLCYLIYPFMQEVLKQIQLKTKILSIILCSGILLWSPAIVAIFHTATIYDRPFFRILEFFIGVSICSCVYENKSSVIRFLQQWKIFLFEVLVFIGAVSVAVHMNFSVGNYMLYSWIGLPMFMLMCITLYGVRSKMLENSRTLRFFASIAYAFFLAQFFCFQPVPKIMDFLGTTNNAIRIIITTAICTAIAAALHLLIEKPASKYLKKLILK